MLASPVVGAFTEGWYAYFCGSLWALGALIFENWRLKEEAEPHLSLVFDPNKQLFDSLHDNGRLRVFRVGVRNSGAPVSNVSVKLARILSCSPKFGQVFKV